MVKTSVMEALTALRQLGAKQVSFSASGELRQVEFFEPPPMPVVAPPPLRRMVVPPDDGGATGEGPRAPTTQEELERFAAADEAGRVSPGRSVLSGLTADDPLFDGVR